MPTTPEQMFGNDVGSSRMRSELGSNRYEETSSEGGPQRYALSLATVAWVDYEKMEVSLRIDSGGVTTRMPVPIPMPGAGHRHFLGAVPEPGDICVIGWGMAESGRTRVPWILGWLVPGVTAGHDWLPTQPYAPDESGTPPKLKKQLEGVYARKRHKLRHMEPGHVVGSSAQGSDIVLNESVYLANRRGNEILLRDQDQALVIRSLQQFHAGAGFRVYSGMVQRDAGLLPSQLFSDGTNWASAQQVDADGNPLTSAELDASDQSEGYCTPATVFQEQAVGYPAALDPYQFLQNGLYISSDGYLRSGIPSDAVYGGKPFYRVSPLGTNGGVDTQTGSFTEFRIELSHLSDGTLPVTEQTDGFDADRLPPTTPDEQNPLGQSPNAPFLEFVLGSVVGNDPFSAKGRDTYGVPLRPVVFDNPGLVTGVGSPVTDHAATLFKIQPPLIKDSKPTFVSFTKDGRCFISLAGPGTSWSSEVAFQSGVRIGGGTEPNGQSILAEMQGSISLKAKNGRNADNIGFEIVSEKGAVRVFGGGSTQLGGSAARQNGGDSSLPGLILESGTNTLVKAPGTITVSGSSINLTNSNAIRLNALSALDFQSGSGISLSSNTFVHSTTGKSTYNYSGPKDGLSTYGALRETTFSGSPATGFAGGTADRYDLEYGDRVETLNVGNHSTTVVVGDQTYTCRAGTLTLTATPSTVSLSSTGISGSGPQMDFTATTGTTAIIGTAGVDISGATIEYQAPSMTFSSPTPGTHTPPGGTPNGGLITDGVLDPITGRTFSASGILGVQTIRVV